MNFKYYLAPFLTVISALIFAQSNIFSVKKYGAVGNGYHDDYPAIQKTFDAAKNTKNSTVLFEKDKQYVISKPLVISRSLDGNNSALKPLSSQAIILAEPNISVENLTIASKAFKYFRINQDKTVLNNCSLSTDSYFALLLVAANNFTLRHSSVNNKYLEEKHYAIHSISHVNNTKIIDNRISGAILFRNSRTERSGHLIFQNNNINVDYSKLDPDFKLQNDAFTFYGISNIQLIDNKITATNVNRLFKISATAEKGKEKYLNILGSAPDNITFKSNIITAYSSNGKQLFDFFIGTKNVFIDNNIIHSKGFSTLFENKTQLDVGNRIFSLINNQINFDSEILYFNGFGQSKDVKNSIIIKNNIFTFDSPKFIFNAKKKGQVNAVKFNYVFNVRNVDRFLYQNNEFLELDNKLQFAGRYFFYIYNPLIVEIRSSSYLGTIKFEPVRAKSIITTADNKIVRSDFTKNIITDQSNKIEFKWIQN